MLVDRHARSFGYLRISVTDRCNFRCVYCMPEEGVTLTPRPGILTFEEIVRVARAGARLGLGKIRLTGGEPTIRKELPLLVSMLKDIPGVHELALTTNGARLEELALPLKEAGMDRLNISLDTLNAEKARILSRRDFHADVLRGIERCTQVGLPFKLNTVAMGRVNDDEFPELVRYAHSQGAQIRFIEYMPMGETGAGVLAHMVSGAEVMALLEPHFQLEVEQGTDPADPARAYVCRNTGARVAFITSMTQNFCSTCNRMRLTAQGGLRPCLHQDAEVDVRSVLRSGGDEDALIACFQRAAGLKWAGHHMTDVIPLYTSREMVSIGG